MFGLEIPFIGTVHQKRKYFHHVYFDIVYLFSEPIKWSYLYTPPTLSHINYFPLQQFHNGFEIVAAKSYLKIGPK
jgi:hypothetical protein